MVRNHARPTQDRLVTDSGSLIRRFGEVDRTSATAAFRGIRCRLIDDESNRLLNADAMDNPWRAFLLRIDISALQQSAFRVIFRPRLARAVG
jgi:hypothetical protein